MHVSLDNTKASLKNGVKPYPRDQLLRVKELAVRARAHFVHDSGLQIHHHRAGHVLAGAGFGEEGLEGVVAAARGRVSGHLAVGLDAVLEAKELPARVTGLDTSLANMDRDAFTHFEEEGLNERGVWSTFEAGPGCETAVRSDSAVFFCKS